VNTKQALRKILILTVTLIVSSGLLVLFVAAIGKKNREHCSGYTITIKGVKNNLFIDENDVVKILSSAVNGKTKGVLIASFNLKKIEQSLENNTWIKDAELYFDNRDVLHVTVLEREPVARIFTTGGNSFYIDSSEKQMPLSDKMSARVPVFTNFPAHKYLSDKDSVLLRDIKNTAWFILNDPFWMSQVAQIDITPERNFEMVPVIGNHIVKLGNGDNIEKKFHRLFVFYREVMSKTGFNKYNTVDVEYKGQVIASNIKPVKVDEAQLKLNVEGMINEMHQLQQDSLAALPPEIEKPDTHLEQQAAPQTSVVARQENLNPNPSKTNPVKSNAEPKINEKPKAVMKRRN
jgi:cell division protein FtsQ